MRNEHSPVWCCVLLEAAALLASPAARADTCGETPSSKLGYRSRKDDERCEGFVARKYSGKLELMSVLRGAMSFPLTKGTVVSVTPAIKEATDIRIHAEALPLGTEYRMDAVLGHRSRLLWPVDEVLLPAGLNAERLAIYGRIGESGAYVPLHVSVGASPSAQSARPVFVIVRSTSALEDLQWRLSPVAENGCSAFGPWQSLIKRPEREGRPISVRLPETQQGEVCVEIQAKHPLNRIWSHLAFHVLMPSGP